MTITIPEKFRIRSLFGRTSGLTFLLSLTVMSHFAFAGTWSEGPDLNEYRYHHTATRTRSGQVVVIGGLGHSWADIRDTAEIYNPDSRTFRTAPGRMHDARHNHTATRLRDGKILVVGGMDDSMNQLDTAEIFDPETGTFRLVHGRLNVERYRHTATRLPNGRVLIVGGVDATPSLLDTAEVFDPAAETFTLLTSRISSPKWGHTATPLGIRSGPYRGAVLIAGGSVSETTCDLFVPRLGRFEYGGDLLVPRSQHTATRISPLSRLIDPSGPKGFTPDLAPNPVSGSQENPVQVLIAGGTRETLHAELYDFATRSFTLTDATTVCHERRAKARLIPGSDPRVLIVGGSRYVGSSTSITNRASEEFFVSDERWRKPNSMFTPRTYHTATRLRTGEILVVGGRTDGVIPLVSSEVYTP